MRFLFTYGNMYIIQEKGDLFGQFHFKQTRTRSLTSPPRVLSKLSHVFEHIPTRFGLVNAKLSYQEDRPGLPIIAQAQPIFIHGTTLCLCCQAKTYSRSTHLFLEYDNKLL